ncbi:MAG: Fic family protein [Alphaproteobacteria bacterium]|nr:Fic family protein [Alphaproteobacteria bacterium]
MPRKPLKYDWDNDELIDLLARVCFAEGSLLTDMFHLPEDRYNQTRAEVSAKEFVGLDIDKARRACEYGVVPDNTITADTLKYWNDGEVKADKIEQVEELLDFVNDEQATHPLIRTAVAYVWFLNLQPFAENNDQTARYLMLAMLSKHEHISERFYAITEVFSEDESIYHHMLNNALTGNKNLTEWIYFFLEAMLQAIQKSLVIYIRESIKTARKKIHGCQDSD